MEEAVLVFVFVVLISIFCGFVAQGVSNHPSSGVMFLLGFFLGPIGILIAAVAGVGHQPQQQQPMPQPVREPERHSHPVVDQPPPEPVIPADRHHYERFLDDELHALYKVYSKSGSHPAVLTMLRRKLPVAKRDIMSRLQQIEDQEQAITHGEHLLDTVRRRLSAAARNIERGVSHEVAV